MVEEAAAEQAQGVRQRRVMRLVVLLCVFDLLAMDEAATRPTTTCKLESGDLETMIFYSAGGSGWRMRK
jgi:hypothetical protein